MSSPARLDTAPNGVLTSDREVSGGSPPAPILIVEDDNSVRDLVAKALEYEGYPVVAVVDGDVALGVLSNPARSVRLVLLSLIHI